MKPLTFFILLFSLANASIIEQKNDESREHERQLSLTTYAAIMLTVSASYWLYRYLTDPKTWEKEKNWQGRFLEMFDMNDQSNSNYTVTTRYMHSLIQTHAAKNMNVCLKVFNRHQKKVVNRINMTLNEMNPTDEKVTIDTLNPTFRFMLTRENIISLNILFQ